MGTELDTVFASQAPAPAFDTLEPEDLSEGIGGSYGILGYRGKTWSLRVSGNTHVFTRPEDGSPINHIDVIILRQGKGKSKSYYPTWDDNVSGERPTCASLDGITPDADIEQPQASSCTLCPHNVFKTLANGRKGKECSDYKRLAVLVLPTQTAPLFAGVPLIEPVFLRVPPASLQSLADMGKRQTQRGFNHPAKYVTRIKFDPLKPHPQMIFEELQPLTNNEAPKVMELVNNPLSMRITGEDQTRALPAPAATGPTQVAVSPVVNAAPAAPTPKPVTAPVTPPPAPVAAPSGLGVFDTPRQPIASAALAEPAAPPTGQAGVSQAVERPPTAAPSIQTAEDTGSDPVPSTADLDARIAALMPKAG